MAQGRQIALRGYLPTKVRRDASRVCERVSAAVAEVHADLRPEAVVDRSRSGELRKKWRTSVERYRLRVRRRHGPSGNGGRTNPRFSWEDITQGRQRARHRKNWHGEA